MTEDRSDTVGKHDWEARVAYSREMLLSASQEKLDAMGEKFSLNKSMWDKCRDVVPWAAKEGLITADVEFEVLFVLGDSFNEHNGGFADRIDLASKMNCFSLVLSLLEIRLMKNWEKMLTSGHGVNVYIIEI